MRAGILSIGTEILMGELVDTNSAFLASELVKLGIEVRWITKVGDDPALLHEAIERAWRRSDVTLTSGGLGPTSDDLTRETIAAVFGETPVVQPDLLAHLESLFAGRGFPMPPTNIKQATLIPSARAIDNPLGTAPGWWAERNGASIIAMPGPPREIHRMWTHEVAPELRARNAGVAIATRNLKTFGISEGGLDGMLTPLFASENPKLGIYSKQDGIHLRAVATAATDADAAALIVPMEAEIRRIVGDDAIWGVDEDTPESKAIGLLRERGLTLGVVDSFTGGVLTNRLADVDGSDDVLRGSIVAPYDALKVLGLDPQMPAEIAPNDTAEGENLHLSKRMAEFARERLGADVGLGTVGLDFGGWYAGVALPNGETTAVSWRGSGFSMSALQRQARQRTLARGVTHMLLELARRLSGGIS